MGLITMSTLYVFGWHSSQNHYPKFSIPGIGPMLVHGWTSMGSVSVGILIYGIPAHTAVPRRGDGGFSCCGWGSRRRRRGGEIPGGPVVVGSGRCLMAGRKWAALSGREEATGA